MVTPDLESSEHQKLALVVGNGDYKLSNKKLENSVKNAEKLSAVLDKIGFNVTESMNITQEDKMTEVVKKFIKKIKTDDLCLFYFSGYGYLFNRNYYLIPINNDIIDSVDELDNYSTNVAQIIKRLNDEAPPCTVIFILDCRRYTFRNPPISVAETTDKYSLNMQIPVGVFIQFSCAANETADDDFFFKHLLNNIAGENVPVTEVFQCIRECVYQERHRTPQRSYINNLPNDPIYLNQVDRSTPENIEKYALIIGNDNYSRQENRLNDSIKNARALADLLTKINFNVTKHEDIIQEDIIIKKVKDFSKTFKNGDWVIFYFSGHAHQVNGDNYLIPVNDADIDSDENVVTFGAGLNRILDRLINDKPLCVFILILDSCRPYVLKRESTTTPMIQSKGLHEMNLPDERKVFIQFSCAADKTTNDDLFNKHLLENLDRKNVPVTEVFQCITERVYQERHRKLKPFSSNGLPEDDPIYLNQVLSSLPNIPFEATWKRNARTVVGNPDFGSTWNRLHSPQGISIANNRILLIADSSNHRIMKYNLRTESIQRIAGKNIQGYGSDLLAKPSNVIFHAESKSFIIGDYHNRRVLQWFPKRKKCAKALIQNIACFGLATDDKGYIYISDPELHQVKRYRVGEKRGKVVAGGNGQGRRLKQLNHPTYICIGDNQSVYVSDSWNDRVVRWDKNEKEGVIVAGFEGKGKGSKQLDYPTGILVDQLGTIYVADHWNHRVMRYRNDEKPDIIAGDRFLPGNDAHQLICPEGLAFDRDGNLYVADSNNHRIQRFRIQIP